MPRRRVPRTAAGLEQLRVHEEHAARELALWSALVWEPEARYAHLRHLSLHLREIRGLRRAGERARIPAPRGCRYHGPSLASCLDHVTAAPRTGPPAGAAAVGTLPDCTGGAVIVT
jgi:hypothetical protein